MRKGRRRGVKNEREKKMRGQNIKEKMKEEKKKY